MATSLSLMRRLPPSKIEQNLSGLLNLLPDDQEELLQRIDQPLEVSTDADVSCYCTIWIIIYVVDHRRVY